MEGITRLAASQLLDGYRRRTISPVEVVDALAARIDAHDGSLGPFTALCLERARGEARAAEAAYRRGEAPAPLAGVPVRGQGPVRHRGRADDVRLADVRRPRAGRDAVAVRRVRDAGAILIGKTQTHEFAWGITSVNRLMGTSRNPWAPDRVSGRLERRLGRRAGRAVRAARARQRHRRLDPRAVGVLRHRRPASRRSAGSAPTGMFPLAPLARPRRADGAHPADAAAAVRVIADRRRRPRRAAAVVGARRACGVGLCPDLHLVAARAGGRRRLRRRGGGGRARGRGASSRSRCPRRTTAYETYGVIVRGRGAAHARRGRALPGPREEYGEDVRGRLELARDDDAGRLSRARRQRASSCAPASPRAFAEVDLLLTPVSAGSPAPIGDERVEHLGERDRLSRARDELHRAAGPRRAAGVRRPRRLRRARHPGRRAADRAAVERAARRCRRRSRCTTRRPTSQAAAGRRGRARAAAASSARRAR